MQRADNIAYDFTLFEDTQSSAVPKVGDPKHRGKFRKNTKIYKLTQKQIYKSRRIKRNPLKVVKAAVAFLFVASLVCAVIVSQVALTEVTADYNVASKDLAEVETIGAQLDMKLKNEFSSRKIEEYATQKLGMHHLEPSQLKYVGLSTSDKAQVVESSTNWLEKLKSLFGFC